MELTTGIKKATDPIYQKISKVIPEIEWAFHAPLIHKINMLKKEKMQSYWRIIIKHQKFFMALPTLPPIHLP